jgi:hypothetical protein
MMIDYVVFAGQDVFKLVLFVCLFSACRSPDEKHNSARCLIRYVQPRAIYSSSKTSAASVVKICQSR